MNIPLSLLMTLSKRGAVALFTSGLIAALRAVVVKLIVTSQLSVHILHQTVDQSPD